VIHLYALTAVPVTLDELAGVDDHVIRSMACPPLHAVVSDHDRAPGVTRERALAHARVVAAAGDRTDAVPVQYGAQHADEDALRAAVAERAEALLGTLSRVGGHVEIVVRFARFPDAGAPSTPAPGGDPAEAAAGSADAVGSGRAYLEGRLELQRSERATRLAATRRLCERTAPFDRLAVEVVDRAGPRGPERCLLVSADQVEPLLAAARAAAAEHGDLVVGGPWPPYTFASGVGDD
jgi:hypothetical protein